MLEPYASPAVIQFSYLFNEFLEVTPFINLDVERLQLAESFSIQAVKFEITKLSTELS